MTETEGKTTINYEEETIEYKIIGGDVAYTYKGVNSSAVETLQPNTHARIMRAIKADSAILQELAEKKAEADRVARIKAHNVAARKFAAEVQAMDTVKKSGLSVEPYLFGDQARMYGREEPRKIYLGGHSCEIYYKGAVSNAWGRRSSFTTKVWVLEFDYKKIRYASLENAIKKAVEKITDAVVDRESREKAENHKEFVLQAIKNYCTDNGLEYNERYHSSRYGSGYHTHEGVVGNTTLNLVYSDEKKEVVVTKVSISSPTKDEIKRAIGEARK